MRRIGSCVLLLTVLVACGKSDGGHVAASQFAVPANAPKAQEPKAPSGQSSPSGDTTPPRQPSTTTKDLPHCKPYNVYTLIYSGVLMTKEPKRAPAIVQLEVAASALKAVAPAKGAIIDEQVTLAKRAGTAAAAPQDDDKLKKNAQDLQKWFEETCL